ncbi:hypothetical protein BJX61DRAFT_232928 [Aspergillus egyptiacus]|nr:hypothetical protein BJX61DRAFT_232928 [Aspergillus egyptiacus]
MDKFQAFGKNLSANFSPFAARTQQLIREQLGQAEDRTQLPDEYIELEKRVDALKLVHQKLLQVTSQYSNEAYDYPPNIRESFNDLGRTISEKVQLLSQASTPARKNVENARLMLDSVKAKYGRDLDSLSEEARSEIEQAEDEFVGQTEEAVSVMKNVLDTPEPLRNLADLIAAQLEYHKRSYEILSELAPVVDSLQVEQEASYRKSREGA